MLLKKMKKGSLVRFRVPGLSPVPGKSHGVVEGKVVSHDFEVEHMVTVTCPLGNEYTLPDTMVHVRDK